MCLLLPRGRGGGGGGGAGSRREGGRERENCIDGNGGKAALFFFSVFVCFCLLFAVVTGAMCITWWHISRVIVEEEVGLRLDSVFVLGF